MANRRHKTLVYTADMSQSEQKIIRKAAAGDRMAFRELVLEHSHAMFRLALRMTCDESAAEDIVQEVFIKAWRNIGKFKMESGFRTWLHRIAVNTAMDYLRKQTSRRRYEAAEPDWERVQEHGEVGREDVRIDIRAQTQEAMMNLSDIERSALLLRHYEGHSIQEIAQILELTTSGSKQAVFRAVKKMRIALRPLVTA